MYIKLYAVMAVGIALGVLSTSLYVSISRPVSEKNPIRCYESPLLNQLDCSKQIIKKTEYANLRLTLEDYIATHKESGIVSDVGIYFRDLKQGPTLGINEYAGFIPASLLKLPTLIAYLRLAEEDPSLLQQTLILEEPVVNDNPIVQNVVPMEEIQLDTPYTIESLLRHLIVYSDNVALVMLNKHLEILKPDVNILLETFKELGLVPDEINNDYTITVKRFSSVFHLLYNATFLSPEMSSKALSYLSEVSFKDGLVAGSPANTLIAHKFGERTTVLTDGTTESQLHDCGIVYYPDNPYILCIMTKGKKFESLTGVIQDISRMVYEEVDNRRLVD